MRDNKAEELFLPVPHPSSLIARPFVVVACDMKQPVDNKGKKPLKEMCA
jgi:hypothetical protein